MLFNLFKVYIVISFWIRDINLVLFDLFYIISILMEFLSWVGNWFKYYKYSMNFIVVFLFFWCL